MKMKVRRIATRNEVTVSRIAVDRALLRLHDEIQKSGGPLLLGRVTFGYVMEEQAKLEQEFAPTPAPVLTHADTSPTPPVFLNLGESFEATPASPFCPANFSLKYEDTHIARVFHCPGQEFWRVEFYFQTPANTPNHYRKLSEATREVYRLAGDHRQKVKDQQFESEIQGSLLPDEKLVRVSSPHHARFKFLIGERVVGDVRRSKLRPGHWIAYTMFRGVNGTQNRHPSMSDALLSLRVAFQQWEQEQNALVVITSPLSPGILEANLRRRGMLVWLGRIRTTDEAAVRALAEVLGRGKLSDKQVAETLENIFHVSL